MNIFYSKNTAFAHRANDATSDKGAIILLDGIPSDPKKKIPLMNELFSRGYDVFFPRYEGIWESKGEFLRRNPRASIKEFINKIRVGINLEGGKYKADKIFLLGASFGGGMALSLANESNVDKVCAISPVLSFKKVKGIETLEKYLKENYSDIYIFKSQKWRRLINDEYYCPDKQKINRPRKVLLVGGSDDDQILIKDLKDYKDKTHVNLKIEKKGHITLSKINLELLDYIVNFFEV